MNKKYFRGGALFFAVTALLMIVACEKTDREDQSNKLIKIEINQSSNRDSLKKKGYLDIAGLRPGDTITKINVVLGCDTTDSKWNKFFQDNSDFEYLSCQYTKIEDLYFQPKFLIVKTKENKIKSISCILNMIDSNNINKVNEAYFGFYQDACSTDSFGLLSSMFGSSQTSTTVSKILGEPLKMTALGDFNLFVDFLFTKDVTKIEYEGLNIYTLRDKVVGIEVLDNEFKNWRNGYESRK